MSTRWRFYFGAIFVVFPALGVLVSALLCSVQTPTPTPVPTILPTPTATPKIALHFPTNTPGPQLRTIDPDASRYTLPQLHKWYDQLSQATDIFGLPEVTLTDLDEGKNRIEVGVACESDRDMVREELQKQLTSLDVPLEAVIFTVRPRAYPLIMPPVFECVPSEDIDPATGLSTPGFGGL